MANKLIEFIIEIKEKFPEGISNNDFEKLLLKNNDTTRDQLIFVSYFIFIYILNL